VQLAKGESGQIGGMGIRFVGFDLNAQGNAMAQMAAGGMVTIGTEIEITRGGKATTLKPVYRLNPANGAVDTPPMDLPGGGAIFVSGINASDGAVQFQVSGISNPAKLSVDVTRKPLIQLVWYGLYIVLLGGAVATVFRSRQVKRRDAVAAAVEE
jgi:cytochrome c-type biogenesis protein CcmF